MRWWRIADPKFALDRSGQGMAMLGGRWNPRGIPAIYAAESISLATLEKFVHLSGVIPTKPMALVAIDLPDDAGGIRHVPLDDLPPDWGAMPSSRHAEQFGARLLQPNANGEHQMLGFTVPSAIVSENRNIVLNPLHPGLHAVTMAVVREFTFDIRMFSSTRSQ